jgi:hypothetical protein
LDKKKAGENHRFITEVLGDFQICLIGIEDELADLAAWRPAAAA